MSALVSSTSTQDFYYQLTFDERLSTVWLKVCTIVFPFFHAEPDKATPFFTEYTKDPRCRLVIAQFWHKLISMPTIAPKARKSYLPKEVFSAIFRIYPTTQSADEQLLNIFDTALKQPHFSEGMFFRDLLLNMRLRLSSGTETPFFYFEDEIPNLPNRIESALILRDYLLDLGALYRESLPLEPLSRNPRRPIPNTPPTPKGTSPLKEREDQSEPLPARRRLHFN